MEDAVKHASSPGAQQFAAITGRERRSLGAAAREMIWYPVGILLGLLVVANVVLLCLPAR
jgi:hypothetical protein